MVTACHQAVATENDSATEVAPSGSVLTLTLSLVSRLSPILSIPLAVLLYKAHLHNFIFLHSLSFSCLPRKIFSAAAMHLWPGDLPGAIFKTRKRKSASYTTENVISAYLKKRFELNLALDITFHLGYTYIYGSINWPVLLVIHFIFPKGGEQSSKRQVQVVY